jgi:hypothetical protein
MFVRFRRAAVTGYGDNFVGMAKCCRDGAYVTKSSVIATRRLRQALCAEFIRPDEVDCSRASLRELRPRAI